MKPVLIAWTERNSAMRYLAGCLCLLALGCGGNSTPKQVRSEDPASVPVARIDTPTNRTDSREEPNAPPRPSGHLSDVGELVAVAGVSPFSALPYLHSATDLPENLGTRKQGDDWPCFLGPQGTSVSTEKGIISPWPAAGPRLVWHKKLGTGYGMPSISRGRLFMFDRIDNSARLRCLKSETGEQLWKFEYPSLYKDYYGYSNGPRCCPVVDENRVYIYGAEGMLHCLRVTDGKPLWKIDTIAKFGVVQNFFGVGSTPVVEGNLLLVQAGGSPEGEKLDLGQKNNGTALVAFNKMTGEIEYKTGKDLASYATPILATIGKERWCFLFARGGLLGIDPAGGKVRDYYPWRARIFESVNAADPIIVGEKVFISETYGPGSSLLRVKDDKFSVVWKDDERARQKNMQCHWNTPIYHDGHVYGCSGRHPSNGELRCIDLETGKVKWSEPGMQRTTLLMVDGHFICLGEDGEMRLLKVNPNKFEEVSKVVLRARGKADSNLEDGDPLLDYPAWAAPILSHGLLYVRGKDRLVCLELIPEKK
jgi:outer membrane protein assembly factor BamB